MSDPLPDPHNVECEQSLLGSVLMNNAAYDFAAEHVTADSFYEPLHGRIWEICGTLIGAGKSATPITLKTFLSPDIGISGMSAAQYLARLAAEAVSVNYAADYAKTVGALHKRRQIIEIAERMAHEARCEPDTLPEEILDTADTELTAIRYGHQPPEVLTMASAVTQAVDMTARVYQGGADIGIQSGVQEISELLGSFMPGDLITLLAASGNGKTALAAQIMTDAAVPRTGTPAASLMFSQEMLAVQIARRAIAAESGVSTGRQRKAQIDFADFDALTAAARKLELMPIYIDQTANQKVSQICRKARHMKKLYGISLVVVDHLLEIRPEHPRWSKFDTIENAARELKRLAKEESLTVLLLAQATREGQKRDHWRLRDQDLFGGDTVKQCSDIMFSITIPLVWLQGREPRPGSDEHFKWQAEAEQWFGKAEISVLKMRDGENGGRRELAWDGVRQTFGSERLVVVR